MNKILQSMQIIVFSSASKRKIGSIQNNNVG